MQLTVLGTGSAGNAYILHNENEALLIEAGLPFRKIKQALNFDLSKLVGCIVTHEHNDHFKAVPDLLKAGVNVLTRPKTFEAKQIDPQRIPNAIAVEYMKTYIVGNFKIMPFDVSHDAADPIGFLIEHPECGRTLFLTDTFYCKYVFPRLNNILIEANFSHEIIERKLGSESGKEFLKDRILRSHFSLRDCVQMLKSHDTTEVNNIVLIHLSDSNSNESEFVQAVTRATGIQAKAAVNGMQIEFNKNAF